MLKPFKDRVFSTKAVIEGILELANKEPDEIVNLGKKADEAVIKKYAENKNFFPVTFGHSKKYKLMDFKGFKKDYISRHRFPLFH